MTTLPGDNCKEQTMYYFNVKSDREVLIYKVASESLGIPVIIVEKSVHKLHNLYFLLWQNLFTVTSRYILSFHILP